MTTQVVTTNPVGDAKIRITTPVEQSPPQAPAPSQSDTRSS